MKSIRTKILTAILALVFFSLALIGGISAFLNYTSTLNTLEQTMTETAILAAERIQGQLDLYKSIARELGQSAVLADPAVSTEEKLALVNDRVAQYDLVEGAVITKDGINIFNNIDCSGREYLLQALAGNVYISEPAVSKATGKLSIMVSAPLREGGSAQGAIIGAIMLIPKEEFLNDIVRTISVSSSGNAHLVDSNGNTIAHADMSRVENGENIEQMAKQDSSLSALAALHANMRQGKTGFGTYSFNGENKFMAYAPLSLANGWSVGVASDIDDFMQETKTGVLITIVLSIGALIIAAICAYLLSRQIGLPIEACTKRLELLAAGDLHTEVAQVNNKDEIGRLSLATGQIVHTMSGIITDLEYGLNSIANGDFTAESKVRELYVDDFMALAVSLEYILKELSATLSQVKGAADHVADGSHQVSAGAQALSHGSTEQAATIEELAATITETSAQINETAQNATETRTKAMESGRLMGECDQLMNEMVDAMNEISENSHQIGNIIKTIEDIAFQTNILALNAAVEAARAGAAGKGFAVVADEVRKLASKSAEASQSTGVLIETSIRSVDKGAKLATVTAAKMDAVAKNSTIVTEMVGKIAVATERQATSVIQLTQGIDQISGVVQTNSATAEQSASASEELAEQAHALNALVAQFRLIEAQQDMLAMNQPAQAATMLSLETGKY